MTTDLSRATPKTEVLGEAELDYLESLIPHMAGAATRQAFLDSLAAGLSVVVAEAGAMVEIFPDGSRRFIGDLPPLVPVENFELASSSGQ